MEKTIGTREYKIVLRLLKKCRAEAGITQLALAAKLNQTQSFVSKVERGERRLDIVELRTFCRAIGVSLAEFVERFERRLTRKR